MRHKRVGGYGTFDRLDRFPMVPIFPKQPSVLDSGGLVLKLYCMEYRLICLADLTVFLGQTSACQEDWRDLRIRKFAINASGIDNAA